MHLNLSFSLAIASACFMVGRPANIKGSFDPLLSLAASLIKCEAGRFNYKIKFFIFINCDDNGDRFTHKSFSFFIKPLQNSIILIPRWPNAGPTGSWICLTTFDL